jgi:ADP-ribose pyrophosphatase YjhB (NUDIX family)
MDLSKNKIDATLIFLKRGSGSEREILLAKKVRKLVVGCPNGFGGSINKRETPRACAVRELRKESNLVAMKEDLKFVGVMTFHNQRNDGSEFSVRVFVFLLKKWRGKLKLKEDEMVDPKWYKINKLPFAKMAPADIFWVPPIFAGKKIKGEAWYGPEQKDLLCTTEIKVLEFLSDID